MKLTYDEFLYLFEVGEQVDESVFYFDDDPAEIEHYLGYLPEYEEPYWAGYCDVENGCAFKTAKELFEAKIYDGKSIRERWANVVICMIGGMSVEDYMEMFGDKILEKK